LNKGLVVFVVVLSLSIGLIVYLRGLSTVSDLENRNNGGGHASYPNFSLAQLKRASTTIVIGVVTQQFASYGATATLPNDIVFQYTISSYMKGNGTSSVYVTDSGSDPNDPMVAKNGDALIAVGQSYVLFLSSDWTCLPSPPYAPCTLPPTPLNNTYHIVGGLEGKFLVLSGLVFSYSALYPIADQGLGAYVNGTNVDSFKSEVVRA